MSNLYFAQAHVVTQGMKCLFVMAEDRDRAVKLVMDEFHTYRVSKVFLHAVPRPQDRNRIVPWSEIPDVSPDIIEDNQRATRIAKAANDGSYNPARPPR